MRAIDLSVARAGLAVGIVIATLSVNLDAAFGQTPAAPVSAAQPPAPQPSGPQTGAATAAQTPAGPVTPVKSAAKAAAAAKPVVAAAPTVLPGTPIPAPQPGAFDAEQAHIARYDAAIAAVRNQAVSPDDARRLQLAVARIAAQDPAGARPFRDEIADPLVRKLADWFRLRSGYGDIAEYRAFITANPTWAARDVMYQRYEEAVFTQGGSARTIKDAFKTEPPHTGAGHAALASAALVEGDETTAAKHARIAWRDYDIAATLETGFLERFGRLLSEADHKWRLDRLLMDDPRWSTDRNERATIVRRVLPLLSAQERTKGEARLAVFLRAPTASALMAALPTDTTTDWGMTYQHEQWLRRSGRGEEAAKILQTLPADPQLIVSPDAWWTERRGIAYEMLRAGNPKLAYDIVRSGKDLSPNPLKDQTFLAGWIALSHLSDAKLAQPHFEALAKAADGPQSQSKAGYWQGRTSEALGRAAEAQTHYKAAAKHIDTFHGQLAKAKTLGPAALMQIEHPAAPTPAQIEKFTQSDAARAAVIARRSSLDRSIYRSFLIQLQRSATAEAEVGMIAHLAEALGDTQMAVRIAKAGASRGFNMVTFAYPLHAFPRFTALRTPPELPLLLGVARQESEFNPQTVSGAGARGLLQVMPITANHVCKDYKLRCDIPRLMTDISYNTTMAAAYIGDRMREFGDSYVLGIAGYNAGPGRARQWSREFGDPRDPRFDPIDWIHRIPFEETREYVQKVLSNVQVYRARMAAKPERLMIMDDLVKGRGSHQSAPPIDPAAGDGKTPEPSDDLRRVIE